MSVRECGSVCALGFESQVNSCVRYHVVVHEAHVRVSTEALEHVCDRLGPRIVARADAPRARLHLAVVVPLVDCQTALRFGHRGVVEHNGPEDLVSAVRPVHAHPFLLKRNRTQWAFGCANINKKCVSVGQRVPPARRSRTASCDRRAWSTGAWSRLRSSTTARRPRT